MTCTKLLGLGRRLVHLFSRLAVHGLPMAMAFACLGASLSSCAGCHLRIPALFCCGDGRRPEIIEAEYPLIIDFDDLWRCNAGNGDEDDEEENEENDPALLAYSEAFQPQRENYVISRGDSMEISIIGDDDTLVDKVTVAPDGRIYYAFFEGIYAEGLTLDELRVQLEEKAKKFFISPSVSLIPRNVVGNKFVVLGRVKNPGIYPLPVAMTLRQGLGMAGGLQLEQDFLQNFENSRFSLLASATNTNNSLYNLRNSFLVRNNRRLKINFQKLLESADNSQDVYLQPGDYIYIAAEERKEVYFLGPGGGRALRYQDQMSVISALSYYGGWGRVGPYGPDLHNVLIVRGSLECPCAIHLDVRMILDGYARDVYLCPGDILYVHSKTMRFGRTMVRFAINYFMSAFAGAAGQDVSNQIFSQDI